MKIVIPGGTGLMGTMLARAFQASGHEVVVLSRAPASAPWRIVPWDAEHLGDWVRELEGCEAVINLAGRSVNCRYDATHRREIMDSRVLSTRAIGQALAQVKDPPRAWLQASTATIYSHRYDAANDEETGELDTGTGGGNPLPLGEGRARAAGSEGASPENPGAQPSPRPSPAGRGGETQPSPHFSPEGRGGGSYPPSWRFSVDVARAWEHEIDAVDLPQTRKVKLRISIVMSAAKGSAFDVLLGLVRRGLGGKTGDGRQYVSWIHQEDLVRSVEWVLSHPALESPVNVAAPNPLPNAEFMRGLRRAWGICCGLPAAKWMVEIGTRLMGTESELVLKSRRVVPTKLTRSGFAFTYPTWPEAAEDLCRRWREAHRGS